MDMPKTITVETVVNAPMDVVWDRWTAPEHITKWAFASDEWEAPHAENDLRTGGKFVTVMAAKDKSARFDFGGEYTDVREHAVIAYIMGDGRHVTTEFSAVDGGVKIMQTFEPEQENAAEMQRAGWQAILDNFKKYAEAA